MGRRKRIGVLVSSTNTTCEADFQMVAPDDVTIHGQRLWLTNDASGEVGMERMNTEIISSACHLATARVDVIAYGCTTGSFYRGPAWDAEILARIEREAGVPAVVASLSVIEALRFFGAQKIAVASPYPRWNNQLLQAYLETSGFDVLKLAGDPMATKAGNQGINDQEPERVVSFAACIWQPEADALFCSCTAWRAMEAADALEHYTSKPVVTSNQATIWAAFRKIGLEHPIHGFGKLLESLEPQLMPAV